MQRRMLREIKFRPYLVALISAVTLLSVSAFSTMAHQDNRVMKKRSAPDEPIELIEVRVDGKLIDFDQPFNAPADNWAETVTVLARNISNKTITAVNIIVAFPTGPKSQVAFTLRYHGETQPNAEIKIACAPQYYKLMPFLAERGETPNFSHASMIVNQVFFSDDTLWAQGAVFRKNAKTGEWDVVSMPSRAVRTTKHHASLGRLSGLTLGRPIETCISVRQQTACDGRPPERNCQSITVNSAYGLDGWFDSQMTSQDCPGEGCGAVAYMLATFDFDCQPLP